MRQPGIEVRGITQPDGTAEFCEVSLPTLAARRTMSLAGSTTGGRSNSTLAFERGQSATMATAGSKRSIESRQGRNRNGRINDPLIRQRLMEYYTRSRFSVSMDSVTSRALNKTKDMGTIALGATNKMFWSEMHKAVITRSRHFRCRINDDRFGTREWLVAGALRDRRRDGCG